MPDLVASVLSKSGGGGGGDGVLKTRQKKSFRFNVASFISSNFGGECFHFAFLPFDSLFVAICVHDCGFEENKTDETEMFQ